MMMEEDFNNGILNTIILLFFSLSAIVVGNWLEM